MPGEHPRQRQQPFQLRVADTASPYRIADIFGEVLVCGSSISRFLGPTPKMSWPAYQSPALQMKLAYDGQRCLGTKQKRYAQASSNDRENQRPEVNLPWETHPILVPLNLDMA